jgi:hypothetical protein
MTIDERIRDLQTRLQGAADTERLRGRALHFLAHTAIAIALGASAVAGIGGVLFHLDSRIIGGFALIPGIASVVANSLKLQPKANFHFRKKNSLVGLERRLVYELPEEPSADNVAAIAKAWTELDTRTHDAWENDFVYDWSAMQKLNPKVNPKTGAKSGKMDI